jgi:hypothetical protein
MYVAMALAASVQQLRLRPDNWDGARYIALSVA